MENGAYDLAHAAGWQWLSVHDVAQRIGLTQERVRQLIRLLDSLQRSAQLLKVTQMAMRLTDERALTLRCSLIISKLLLTPLPASS